MSRREFPGLFFLVAGAFSLVALIQKLLPWLAEKFPSRLRLNILPMVPILRLIVLALSLLIVLPLIIRPNLHNFLAVFGAIGLAVGIAFKDYVSSLIAGVVAIYEQPYRPGDWVRIEDTYGEVQSMGLRSIRVITPDDTMVTIPHSKIWATGIRNANCGRRDHLCVADFYLHPDHDARQVRQKLYDVALTSPFLQIKRPLTVVVAEKPWGTHYRVKAYPVDGRGEFQFVSDLTIRGKEALAEIGAKPALARVVAEG
ncbi:MAG: mechanosensitive ion channel family protein [Pseudomonadota bacterium]